MKPLVWTVLVAALTLSCSAQEQAAKDFSDPMALLQAVARKYGGAAETFRLKSIIDSEHSNDLDHQWNRTYREAVKGPGAQYSIEVRTGVGSLMQVSDGESEWVYQPESNSYVKRPLPANWPEFPKVMDMAFNELFQAWSQRTFLEDEALAYKRATMLREETIVIEGHRYACYVVRANSEDSSSGHNKDYRADVTFWIDKQGLVFRKIRRIADSSMIVSKNLHVPTHFEQTETYTVAEIDPETTPAMFRFTPPADAKEVASLEPDYGGRPPSLHPTAAMVGQTAPDLSFSGTDGKRMELSSFRGKPVLMDFWATWCGPCLLSMPALSRIYSETRDKGLQVIGFDQSTTADDAAIYLRRHQYRWTNYHDEGKAVFKGLKGDGIPLMVLIDGDGKIVYYDFGGDERELRKAIAGLGPEFASIAAADRVK